MKLLCILVSVVALYVGSQLNGNTSVYQTYYGDTKAPVIEAEVVSVRDWEGRVYDHIVAQGFPDPKLMLAIAKAESGLRIDALGDTTITDKTWGPSVGLYQVRTLRTQNKGCRDYDRLWGNLEAQTSCAKQIWDKQGYQAWSVYLNGSYRKYLQG